MPESFSKKSWVTPDSPPNLSPTSCSIIGMNWMDPTQSPAGDRMAPIATRINRDYAAFCELLVEADHAQEWLADGSPSIVQWLSARFGIQESFGRRLAKLAKRLQDLPELTKRFATGELSFDAVELLSEVATRENELDLIENAKDRDLHDIARMASRSQPPTIDESADARSAQWLSTQWDLRRQKMRVAGQLTGVGAQIVEDRLVEGAKQIPKNLETGEYDDWDKRMADSLIETCATSSDQSRVPIAVVHAELEALTEPGGTGVSELAGGPVIANEMARMLACDCDVETVIEKGRQPIGIGRKSRKIPGWLRRQVIARDHHCRAPGCGRTVFLQIHHIQSWADLGETELENLILLCWWHHIFIHENGWHITRDPGGRFVFRKPDWTPYLRRPT